MIAIPQLKSSICLNILLLSLLTSAVQAQDQVKDDELPAMDEVVVSATRSETPASQLTRSVTVLDRESIEQQSAISRDLGDILGKTVPGLGTSTEGLTNFTQTLRGRDFLVMVDGIPISIPLVSSARDLKILSPESVDQVEVIRGGTAAYGFGATGGLVNYITREPQGEEVTGFSEAGIGLSAEHPDGSFRWHTAHGASGQAGPFDFVVNGSFAQNNRSFDADGDRIPPDPLFNQGGLADTDEWNIFGKIGFDFDQQRQRLELMVNNYDISQDTDFVTEPGNPATGRKARGVPGGPPENQTKTENALFNLSYQHQDILGSEVKLQAHHMDYEASFPINPPLLAGSINESEKFGTRLTINTPIAKESLGANVTWGLDFLNEQTNETIVGSNPAGTADIPDMDQDALAGFLQLEVPVADLGLIRGGVRHEEFWLDVPTFSGPGGTVTGAELTYDATLFNATAIAFLSDEVELFGGFSQGFTIGDVGATLQQPASAPNPFVPARGGGGNAADINPQAQEVDNYEMGLRGNWGWLRGSVAGFYSESDLGTTFQSFGVPLRQPEEIWGVESSLEMDLHRQWTVGGTATWMDSRTDSDGDGSLDEELPTRRVPPVKLTGFAEYRPTPGWSNRLQVLYSGSREPDGAVNFAGTADEVNSFVIVDYHASIQAGPGNVRIGVENLLNEDYFPVAAQAFGTATAFSKGTGRTASLGYHIKW